MSRRHDALIPLSQDHHRALHEARLLKKAADADDAERVSASRGFIQFFRDDSIQHFREEEEIIFPVVALEADAPMEDIARVVTEHVRLHALVRALDENPGDAATMRELATLLRAHVRFEEDELFPSIERVAATALARVRLPPRARS